MRLTLSAAFFRQAHHVATTSQYTTKLLSHNKGLTEYYSTANKHFKVSQTVESVELSFDAYKTLKNEAKVEKTCPLVLIHGLFGAKQNWRAIAKSIQNELDNFVFVVDMRNHGDSPHSPVHTYPAMAQDLDIFLKKVVLTQSRYKTAFLLGHSMGGKVVCEFALNESKSSVIEKLIVEDVAPHRSSISSSFADYIRVLKRLNLDQTKSEMNRALKVDIPDDAVRGFLLTNLHKPRNGPFRWRCNLDALEANLENLFTYKVDTEKRKADCSTLFISGQKSTFLTREDRPAIRKLFPRAEFEEIKGAGHWVHSEKPEEFLRIVIAFLKSGYFTYESDSNI